MKRERLGRLWGWALDLVSASYHAETRKSEAGKDVWVVAKVRGGLPWYPDVETHAFVRQDGDGGEVWQMSKAQAAKWMAEGYQRSLAAQRRTIILFIGFGTTLGLRLAGIGLI